MNIRFSNIMLTIAEYARQEAMRTGWRAVTPDHLMLGILRHSDNDACRTLRKLGVDTREMKKFIDERIFQKDPVPYGELDRIILGNAARAVLGMSAFEALKLGETEILPADLLSALSRTEGNATSDFLKEKGITTKDIAAIGGKSPRGGASAGKDADTAGMPGARELSGVLSEQLKKIYGEKGSRKILN